MRYTVVMGEQSADSHDGLDRFAIEVSILVRDGWTVMGSISSSAVVKGRDPYAETIVYFFQALIKEREE